MRGELKIRKTKTASGATAVQVVRYEGKRCIVEKHMGSAHDDEACLVLMDAARRHIETRQIQPDLFTSSAESSPLLHVAHTRLIRITHLFARNALHSCARLCGLSSLPEFYVDLALMRIIEPTSKRRTIELLQRYFDIHYAERTAYRQLPMLLDHQAAIEAAAIQTALKDLKESFSLVLYDVTTLYFESFKEYEFQCSGFSKDNKPQQPQIVIGLLTTRSGFPVMHKVFEGNTFEGHTMLDVVHCFQQRFGDTKPVVVADAAMLSQTNMQQLEVEGYRYIVGARLANTSKHFINQVHDELSRTDKAMRRFTYESMDSNVSIVCEFSEARYKKDKREFDKQVNRAQELLRRNEPGRRAKFVKKSGQKDKPFMFDEALKAKAEKLLGIKGYITNISEQELANAQIITYYRELWHVEQAFRMSKSDLQTRPIFHRAKDAIRAHILICFVALMLGKYLEIKTGFSLRKIRDELWQVHEAHIQNGLTGEVHVLCMEMNTLVSDTLQQLLENSH